MSLPAHAIVLVLLAAFCHAGWNAAMKIGADRLVVLGAINGVGAVVALALLPLVALPTPQAWPWLIASVAIHTLYYACLIAQYRVGDLSHVYPLARGLSPLLVAAGAAGVAGEALSLVALCGIALASAGIVSLAFEGGPPWRRDARPVLYACTTAVVIACYTVVDGMGVRAADGALSYVVWLFFLDGLPLAAFAAVRRGRELSRILVLEWRKSLLGGSLMIVAYGLVIWAMSLGPMAQVSALRETSVIFATLLGVVMLRERFGMRRIVAAILVVTGLVVLNALG
jgi:drug/metabolite transporter (DMT)-like permease